jgi:hypothetical protein
MVCGPRVTVTRAQFTPVAAGQSEDVQFEPHGHAVDVVARRPVTAVLGDDCAPLVASVAVPTLDVPVCGVKVRVAVEFWVNDDPAHGKESVLFV